MERSEIKGIIEALIFVSEEPVTIDLMTMVLEEAGVSKKEAREILDELKADYAENYSRGLRIVEVAGGYQLRTKASAAEWIQKLNVPKPIRLSQAAMETLAIIAYRQPVLRSGVEEIRGVDSGGVIKTLLERGLIRIIGKSDDPGNPLVYGTTKRFLEVFGLKDLKELPTLKEIEELSVQEKIGVLGKDELDEKNKGVSEVVAEYQEEILAYNPNPEKEKDDFKCLESLQDSVKNLRRLEKAIFPKPKEELKAVLKDESTDENRGMVTTTEEVSGEGATTEDNSTVN